MSFNCFYSLVTNDLLHNSFNFVLPISHVRLECEQSQFFLSSSSSHGKTLRTPARVNLQLGFRAPKVRDVFPRLEELESENRDCSQSIARPATVCHKVSRKKWGEDGGWRRAQFITGSATVI